MLFARYTVKSIARTDWTFRIAPFGGVKVPTGRDDHSGPLGAFPRPLQPGVVIRHWVRPDILRPFHEMARQRPANLRASPVQKHPLIGRREIENIAHDSCLQPLRVA